MLDDGSRITVEIRENLIRGDHDEVTGVVRSLLDVTERNLAAAGRPQGLGNTPWNCATRTSNWRRALEAARLATEAKSRFLAGVSHELRTPLNGIIGFSELMYDAKLGPVSEEHKDVLGDILTSARHLLQLINDILDLSKVEAGKMEFHPEQSRIDSAGVRGARRGAAAGGKEAPQAAINVPGGSPRWWTRRASNRFCTTTFPTP